MKRVAVWALQGILLAAAVFVSVAPAPSQIAKPAGLAEDQHYNLPFGADKPWAPSQAQAEFSGFLRAEDVPSAAYCGKCHQKVHNEWRESAHSNSFREPFYVKNVQMLIDSKGIEFTRHCEGCHNPVALFTGALTKGSKIDRGFDEDGITCAVCHSMAKLQNTSGTGSYVMGIPTAMVREDGTPIPGEVPYDDIFARPDLHRKAVMKDFYRTPEFCASCHKAAVPQQLNGYKWLRAFSVYDEWQQSSWAKQSPMPFYKKDEVSTCQTCHMPPVDSKADYGHKNGKVASHRWLGANSAIPVVYGYTEQLKQTEEFLKDNLGIDIFAVTKGPLTEQPIAPLDRNSFTLLPGEKVTFDTVIQNKKIGHSLIPEQRDFYEAWVEFKVTDEAGKVVYHSGFLKPNGYLDERAHTYTNRMVGADGKLLNMHQVWATKIRGYDNTIMPGRSELVRYQFEIPRNAKGKLHISARVRYRRFMRHFTDFVFGESRDMPIFEMGSKSITLYVGRNTGTKPESPDADRLRWNNYGIALLDEQEFARSAAAFKKVIQANPKAVDGYINVGVAEYSGGSYNTALKWLKQALDREPNNMRAKFYMGLTLRWQFKYDQAIEHFLPVIEAYPRLRQARQELAYVYLQQKKYELSREQFEAVQQIDPDDVFTHRWLVPVYTALGMKEKAAEQAKYISDRKEDPVASWTVQEYWRKNMDVATEVAPYHVHAEDREVNAAAVKKLLNLSNPPSFIWIQGDQDWAGR